MIALKSLSCGNILVDLFMAIRKAEVENNNKAKEKIYIGATETERGKKGTIIINWVLKSKYEKLQRFQRIIRRLKEK